MAIIKLSNSPKYEFTEYTMQWFIANYFGWRQDVIVPNVSWGAGIDYEIDLLIIKSSLYCHEIEIKVSKADIKKDLTKAKCAHNANFVKYFSYAVPEHLKDCEYLPSDCGLIAVKDDGECYTVRPPRRNKRANKITVEKYLKILRLCNFRMWNLKRNDFSRFIYRKNKQLKENN